jgi:hypothetical protein
MSLIGSLDEVTFADALRMLADARKTGILTVSAPGAQAVVRFNKGAIVYAAAGRFVGEEAVVDLFGWKEGQLSFVPEDKLPAVPPNVARPMAELVEEGLRLGPTRHRLHTLIPSDRVVFQMALGPAQETARVSVGVKEWRVIRVLDGARDVAQITEASQVPKIDVMRILCDLTEAGFLQKVEVQKVLRVQVLTGLFAKDGSALDERLRDEWTRVARFEDGVQRVQVRTMAGKSLVVSASFRGGLGRDIQLSRTAIGELGLREGEDVHVRPVP